MTQTFTDEVLSEALGKESGKAKEYLEDQDKMERFLVRLEKKLEKIPVAGKPLALIPVLISLVRSYMKKEYTDIPIGTVIAIVSGLIYLFSPVDLIPDSIPLVGMADDAAVLAFVLKMVNSDVEEYKAWKQQKQEDRFE